MALAAAILVRRSKDCWRCASAAIRSRTRWRRCSIWASRYSMLCRRLARRKSGVKAVCCAAWSWFLVCVRCLFRAAMRRAQARIPRARSSGRSQGLKGIRWANSARSVASTASVLLRVCIAPANSLAALGLMTMTSSPASSRATARSRWYEPVASRQTRVTRVFRKTLLRAVWPWGVFLNSRGTLTADDQGDGFGADIDSGGIRLVPVDNSLIFINFMSLLRAKRTDSLTNRFFLLSIWPV